MMPTHSTPHLLPTGRLCGLLVALVALAAGGCATKVDPNAQTVFISPHQAARMLADAARARDAAAVRQMFGPQFEQIASGGDALQDDGDFQRFAAAYDRRHEVRAITPSRSILIVGEHGWVFPAPIVYAPGGWHFDAVAGMEEMTNRRIGRNELGAIDACRAYVAAQRQYYAMDPDGDGVPAYAMQVLSDPGRRNGLYWPDDPAAGVPMSPLGPRFAGASPEALRPNAATGRRNYRGYYYKILRQQAGSAPGGAGSYVDESGRMTRGFALIAWPAEYGKTGVMSFCVGPDGVVYQGDLGPAGDAVANRVTAYDPAGWTPVR